LQAEQVAPASGDPQLAQKRPEAGAEQDGQRADADSGTGIGGDEVIPQITSGKL
jgi:hypothetical protein